MDGGMTANVLFNQVQANIFGRATEAARTTEISGWGAAVAGGIGAGIVSLEEFVGRSHHDSVTK